MCFKKILFLYIVFSCSLWSVAQQKNIAFKHISVSSGLSQSSAIAIQQDKLGQIWVGTRDGLNKYDGNTFTVYRHNPNKNSISNNDILSILEDKEGFIWIGTYNGLNKYDPKKNTFTTYFHQQNKSSLSNNTIWTIKELYNGEIWLGTSDGLSIYNKKTNTFTNVYKNENKQNSLLDSNVYSILQSKDSTVWVGTKKGLSKLTYRAENNFKFKNFSSIENSNISAFKIQDIIENNTGNLLLASETNGIIEFNKTSEKISELYQNTAISKNVRQLIFDSDNALWVGTYNGLFIVDKDNTTTALKHDKSNPKSLSKNSIKSLFKDKKGSIWVGTYYGGLNLWDASNINFINYTANTKNALSFSVVSAIAHYKSKTLFFATENKGISVLDKQTNRFWYINQNKYKNLSNGNIKSLLVDNESGLLYIGTFNTGLDVFDIKNKVFKTEFLSSSLKKLIKNTGVYTIKKHNNTLLIGTFGKGLFVYNLDTKAIKRYLHNAKDKNTITNNLIRTLHIDKDNNIWVGTQKGLSKISENDNITRYFYNANVASGDDITTIFEDTTTKLWIGTKARGLFKLENNTFVTVNLNSTTQKVSNIHSLLEDDANQLWVSTNQGLFKYNYTTKQTTNYNLKDGIISNEYNDNASLKINNTDFYFGGPNGVTSFNSKAILKNTYAPQVIITDFKVKNNSVDISKNSILKETIPFTKNITLSYLEGNFTIQFAIPNFINSKNNRYKYRLKGLEDNWVYTKKNTVSYTLQNSGNYTFELKGANSDGVWNTTATSLAINVKPAPWFSWWAFCLYGLLIASTLYLFISIKQSKTKLKLELALEHKENERIEEANKAKLEFFTNISHEFRTPLTLILGPLSQVLATYKGSSKMYKKLLVIENSANHLLHLINRLMDFRKLEKNLFKLEAAEGNIVKFLKEIYLSFSEHAKDGGYEYNFNTTADEILVYYDRYKLERVFYNLISNAFRYTPKNGIINIRVKTDQNQLIVSVEDSGVGVPNAYKEKIFDRFFEVAANNKPDNSYNIGTGIGLSIAKNIVQLHKGSIGIKDNSNTNGSVFYIKLPLGKAHLTEQEVIKDFKFSDDVSQYVTQLNTTTPIIEDSLEDSLEDNVKNTEKATILLVEDNIALRKFMKNILKEDYNILEAENGKIGLKIAIKDSPNLIISDVIMPVMVGTELCSELKSNIKTSHIPIILLTSRSSLIYKLEGLESGADDYISKPFNVNEFTLRIKNILQSTTRLKEKFSGENALLANEVVVSSLDEKLYKKALEIVEHNISNDAFDIPFFCSELGVSRTMLFVKIKAWTNFTPNDFIQHIRLKRAALLLEQGKINISEVSYKVGFKNPKYFSKCFVKKFEQTPSQYSKKFTDF